jgi:hypothetical protein
MTEARCMRALPIEASSMEMWGVAVEPLKRLDPRLKVWLRISAIGMR